MTLTVAPCDFAAAKYAIMHWHYSRTVPKGKLVTFGAWEDSQFIGAVVYGRGVSDNLGTAYGLDQTEVCELVRVALTAHRKVSKLAQAYPLADEGSTGAVNPSRLKGQVRSLPSAPSLA
jgi:hypothetical protein